LAEGQGSSAFDEQGETLIVKRLQGILAGCSLPGLAFPDWQVFGQQACIVEDFPQRQKLRNPADHT
jgi:hypothetical protein